jgi:dTDP-4-amino-4,6-dideoxygalactose transaminase
MIPRVRPPFSLRELLSASISRSNNSIVRFELKCAEKFGFSFGLFFPYGRSALYTLLQTMDWDNEEVVLPAYICVVVPNAVVLSGNKVKFVDNEPDHFNVSAKSLSSALSDSTRMIIPTPLYGFPIDRRGYEEVIAQKAPHAFVLYDLAQAFGVEDEDGLQASNSDGAFVGFGMGKMLSSIEGGMLLLHDEALYKEVESYRNRVFGSTGFFKGAERFILGIATYWALREPFLTFVDFVENKTSFLDRLGGEIPVEDGPFLPDNVDEMPTKLQAELGLLQLANYEKIIEHRREIAYRYDRLLNEAGFPLFSSLYSPTYAQFPLMVNDQERVISALRKYGIQVKIPFPYSCSELPGYEDHRGRFPNAVTLAKRIIALPNWFGMTHSGVDRVVEALNRCREKEPDIFF